MTEHNIATLPKWAQTLIKNQESDIAFWENKFKEMASTETTNVVASIGYDRPPFPLPKRTAIEFNMPGDARARVRVGFSQSGKLEVSSVGNITGRLIVHPVVANLIEISVDTRVR